MKYFLLLSLIIITSCTDKKALEPAIGLPGKLNIIMAPELWDGPVGKNLDSIYSQEMTVLPRPELTQTKT